MTLSGYVVFSHGVPVMRPEELRDSKYKESSGGQLFSKEEDEDWRARVAIFLSNDRPAASARELAKQTKKVLERPRAASLDFILCLNNALRQQLGMTLKSFDVGELLEACKVEGGKVVFPCGTKLANGILPMLTISADQASDQCCPFSFMRNKLCLNFEKFPDLAHMSNNSTLNAAIRSGFHSTVRLSISIFNVRYGPRNNGAFQRALETAAADISANIACDDPLVRLFWGQVCRDRRWQAQDEVREASCAAWLRSLCASRAANTKGPQAGTSRRYSYIHTLTYWDEYWTETLIIGVFLAVCSGWAKQWKDIFSPSPKEVSERLQAMEAELVRQASSGKAKQVSIEDGPPPASSSSSAPAAPDRQGASAAASSSSGVADAPSGARIAAEKLPGGGATAGAACCETPYVGCLFPFRARLASDSRFRFRPLRGLRSAEVSRPKVSAPLPLANHQVPTRRPSPSRSRRSSGAPCSRAASGAVQIRSMPSCA